MKVLLIALLSIQLTACASIITGTTQVVSLETSPKSAQCELENDKGKWLVKETPSNVSLKRSYEDISVTCKKDGLSGSSIFKSKSNAMGFGNILVGGAIGAGVDTATGAAFDYPSVMKVELK